MCTNLHSKKLSHHQYLVPKVYFDINHRNHVGPCSHYAKFCLLCKKICRQETISSENNFFHLPKFSQVSSNFKDAFEKIWRLRMFFVSRQDSCFRYTVDQNLQVLFSLALLSFVGSSNCHFWLLEKLRTSEVRTS